MKIRDNPVGYLVMLAVVIVLAVAGCGPTSKAPPTYAPTAPASVIAAPAAAPAAAPTTAAPPPGTVSQVNAVEKANSYLEFSAFSKTGLIRQLKYEGFSAADAEYAAGHVTVNWLDQAAKKAQSYMESGAFSRSGLIRQLKYEGFTAEEAVHGADSVGLK